MNRKSSNLRASQKSAGLTLQKVGILSNDLSEMIMEPCLKLFEEECRAHHEELFLRVIIDSLAEKGNYLQKLKLLTLLLEVSKLSKYDVCDILMSKKIKFFITGGDFSQRDIGQGAHGLESYLAEDVLLPIYDYLLRLIANEELYTTCREGRVPNDEIFRRGTKIRFVWMFKLYNLIHILCPILSSLKRCLSVYPQLKFLQECAKLLFKDLVIMNNFVLSALEEAINDNFILMPYFDLLQFYESLKQQLMTWDTINALEKSLRLYCLDIAPANKLNVSEAQINELEVHALRVALISNTLKNPKKDNTRQVTQYNEKRERLSITQADREEKKEILKGSGLIYKFLS